MLRDTSFHKIIPINEITTDNYEGLIGIKPFYREVGVFESIFIGFTKTIEGIVGTAIGLFELVTGGDREGVGGPIKIAQMSRDWLSEGVTQYIALMAILSISLGVINIIPFPGLDGGHAIIAIIEGITRKRIPFKAQIIVQGIGMILLLLLMVAITTNDIMNIFAG